jgi:hypothetical protein
MADKKKSKKKQTNDSQLIVRITTSERDQFVALCNSLDTSASREMRRFIRGFLKDNAGKS